MGRDAFRTRLLVSAAIIGMMFTGFAGLWGYLYFGGASPRAYSPENLLRLHVLANSNSPEDQRVKLEVRDAVLRETGRLFNGVATVEEAKAILEENLDHVEKTARLTLAKAGHGHQTVTAELGTFTFPPRRYGRLSLAAGEYQSLQVIIGQGQGRNWWCVLFPPLCLLDEGVEVELQPQGEQVTHEWRWKTWEQVGPILAPWGQKLLAVSRQGLSSLLLGISPRFSRR